MSLRDDALLVAQHYVDWDSLPGHHLEVGQNHGPLVDHFLAFVGLDNPDDRDGYPYCAAGACTCLGEALGFPKTDKAAVQKQMRAAGLLASASVAAMEQYARDHGVWVPVGTMPEIGWLVVFKFSHIGFVRARYTDVNRNLARLGTTEFNTQPGDGGDQREGGGAYNRERAMKFVKGYIRVP